MFGKTLKIGVAVGLAAIALFVGWRGIEAQQAARRQLAAADVIVVTNWKSHSSSQNYAMEIHRDGEIVFNGGPDVLLPGEHRILVSRQKTEDLFRQVEDSSFLGMKPLYKGWVSPTQRSKLCVRGAGFERCVEAATNPIFNTTNEPKQFDELVSAAYAIASPERWIRATPQTVRVFEQEGLDPRSLGGQRLVFAVAEAYDLAAMQALIARGFPLDATRIDPFHDLTTPVEVAAYNGRLDILRALLDAGAWTSATPEVKQRALLAASRSCQPEIVQTILDEGVVLQPKAMTIHVLRCRDGVSRQADAPATAALMVKHGLPVDARDANGHTLLHSGVGPDVVRLLLRHGADPNARDDLGVPPLLTVSNEEAAIALIEAGADIDATHDRTTKPEEWSTGESIDIIASNAGWTRVQALVNARRAEARAKAR